MNGNTTVNHPTGLTGCKIDNIIIINYVKFIDGICLFIITDVILPHFFAFVIFLLFFGLSKKPFDMPLLLVMMELNVYIYLFDFPLLLSLDFGALYWLFPLDSVTRTFGFVQKDELCDFLLFS